MLKVLFTTLVLFYFMQVHAMPLALDEFNQPNNDQSVQYSKYTSVLNCKAKTPRYVYYNLSPESFKEKVAKRGSWWPKTVSEEIKAICGENYANDKNYKRTGYSRGHLNPAANYKVVEQHMKETFTFANAAPQEQDFNGGLWASIENIERDLAVEHNGVTVITGVIHKGSTNKIKNDISVPVYFYKIVLWKDEQGIINNMAWLVENDEPDKGLKPANVITDIDIIEAISGLDFVE